MRRMYSLEQLKNVVDERLASGQVPEAKIFENIVDKNGHKRFIEGDIALSETFNPDIEIKYKKWSLSGSHLIIVVSMVLPNTLTLANTDVFEITLPSWVLEKIVATFSDVIEIKYTNAYATDYTAQSVGLVLRKASNKLTMGFAQSVTVTKKRTYRMTFDLLIDNN